MENSLFLFKPLTLNSTCHSLLLTGHTLELVSWPSLTPRGCDKENGNSEDSY